MPDRRLVPSLIVAGLLGLAGTTPSLALARQPVVDCDSSAMEDINWALDFATAHVEPVLAQATYLPSKYTDRIRKDWDKTSVKCSNKKSCNETTGKLGFDRGGNQIKLCWDNIRSLPKTVFRCDLVKIIFHEKGHAANIPIEARHNEWPTGYPYVPHIDLVYRLGDDAESYCISLATCSPGAVVPKELKLKGLGESCTLDGDCASAHCEGAKSTGAPASCPSSRPAPAISPSASSARGTPSAPPGTASVGPAPARSTRTAQASSAASTGSGRTSACRRVAASDRSARRTRTAPAPPATTTAACVTGTRTARRSSAGTRAATSRSRRRTSASRPPSPATTAATGTPIAIRATARRTCACPEGTELKGGAAIRVQLALTGVGR